MNIVDWLSDDLTAEQQAELDALEERIRQWQAEEEYQYVGGLDNV